MCKLSKKLFTVTIMVMTLLVFSLVSSVSAEATEEGNENNGNITWKIDGTTLTISGSGHMEDYERVKGDNGYISTAPWTGENIEKIVVEEGVTSIGDYAFYWCETVTEVILPNGLKEIGNDSFDGCAYLTKINIPQGVTEIGEYAFCECYSLPSIEIPTSVKTIGNLAFSYCASLTSIDIPEGVENLGESVFLYCNKLSKITLPDSLKTIGDNAFADCYRLEEIELPANLESVGQGLFTHAKFTEINCLKNVTVINEFMFNECVGFVNIEIPKHITSIESRAFYGSWNLESVIIHENVKSISDNAFELCDALTTIYGVKGSYAEKFATENGYTFVELKEEADDKEYTVEITEEKTAISKEEFSEIVKENAEKDIVIKSNNDVVFTFPKGTMTEVKGMEKYDFGTEIIKDFDDKKEHPHKVDKDNFVTRINFNYSGKLPGKVSIKFFVGTDRIGATLHYSLINDDNSVTYIQSVVVDKDGYITVQQDHCSDYVVTTERIDVSDETETDAKEETTTDNVNTVVPDTSDSSNNAILLLLMSVAAMAVFMLGSKRNRKCSIM